MAMLSDRELFVVKLRQQGATYQQIAERCAEHQGFGNPSRERVMDVYRRAVEVLIKHAVESGERPD